jgi:hypothetical protein
MNFLFLSFLLLIAHCSQSDNNEKGDLKLNGDDQGKIEQRLTCAKRNTRDKMPNTDPKRKKEPRKKRDKPPKYLPFDPTQHGEGIPIYAPFKSDDSPKVPLIRKNPVKNGILRDHPILDFSSVPNTKFKFWPPIPIDPVMRAVVHLANQLVSGFRCPENKLNFSDDKLSPISDSLEKVQGDLIEQLRLYLAEEFPEYSNFPLEIQVAFDLAHIILSSVPFLVSIQNYLVDLLPVLPNILKSNKYLKFREWVRIKFEIVNSSLPVEFQWVKESAKMELAESINCPLLIEKIMEVIPANHCIVSVPRIAPKFLYAFIKESLYVRDFSAFYSLFEDRIKFSSATEFLNYTSFKKKYPNSNKLYRSKKSKVHILALLLNPLSLEYFPKFLLSTNSMLHLPHDIGGSRASIEVFGSVQKELGGFLLNPNFSANFLFYVFDSHNKLIENGKQTIYIEKATRKFFLGKRINAFVIFSNSNYVIPFSSLRESCTSDSGLSPLNAFVLVNFCLDQNGLYFSNLYDLQKILHRSKELFLLEAFRRKISVFTPIFEPLK